MTHSHPPFSFFGTPDMAVEILEELKICNYIPSVIVTAPDKPKGRSLKVTPPPVKNWAIENGVPYLQPEILDEIFMLDFSDGILDGLQLILYFQLPFLPLP